LDFDTSWLAGTNEDNFLGHGCSVVDNVSGPSCKQTRTE
jgi:hypothetical protein